MSIIWDIQTHDRMDSTQDTIKAMAEQGAQEGRVVRALEQTDGHGRHGRKWDSQPGNLFLSLLLRPSCSLENIGQLSILTGVVVAKTLRNFIQKTDVVSLKWPNDALLDGQKCAGILLETGFDSSKIDWVAIGVGINIVNAPQEGSCAQSYVGDALDIEEVKGEFLRQFSECHERWQRDGMNTIKEEWLGFAHKRGTPVTVKIGSQIEHGEFYDIDEHGSLLLSNDNGKNVKKITAGDVYL